MEMDTGSNVSLAPLDSFATNLYQELVGLSPQSDLICSPLSIQICAAMVRMGAEDESETAKQLDTGLNFNTNDVIELAAAFHNVLDYYQQCSVLKIANKIYVKENVKLRPQFNDILTHSFLSTPENIDFAKGSKAAATINGWVETTTNSLIKDLVKQDDLNANTSVVLVNAIHFKGEWADKFNESATRKEEFFVDMKTKVQVSMMNSTKLYDFAHLQSLDATALRLAYKDTALHMLIILPNTKQGLAALEEKLQTVPLASITRNLNRVKVSVKLPKFKTEFSQELTPVFKALGIERLFSDEAELRKMVAQTENLSVSKILHKAFIEVNEEGTEAAAATTAIVMMRSLPAPEPQPEIFHAKHPFYYIIYDENHGCLFVGNLKSPVETTEGNCRCGNIDRSKCI